MSKTKTDTPEAGDFTLVGFATFGVVVSLFVFVSTEAGTRGIGASMMLGAALQQRVGRIPYGWEGQPPSGHLTGGIATAVNLLLALVGLGIVIWPEVAMGVFGWDAT